jgi:hypothetical protein
MHFLNVKQTKSLYFYINSTCWVPVYTRSKVLFFTLNKRAILSFVASNQCALTSAVSQIFFTDVSCILIMFPHYFGQEGGRTMVTMFAREAWNGGSLSLANFVNSLTAGGA